MSRNTPTNNFEERAADTEPTAQDSTSTGSISFAPIPSAADTEQRLPLSPQVPSFGGSPPFAPLTASDFLGGSPPFGRDEKIKEFWKILTSGFGGKSHIYLRDVRRIGKTEVMMKMKDDIAQNPIVNGIEWHAIYLDVEVCETIEELSVKLHTALKVPDNGLRVSVKEIPGVLENKDFSEKLYISNKIDLIREIFSEVDRGMEELSKAGIEHRFIFFFDEIPWAIEKIAKISVDSDSSQNDSSAVTPEQQDAKDILDTITQMIENTTKHIRFVLSGSYGLELALKRLGKEKFLDNFVEERLKKLKTDDAETCVIYHLIEKYPDLVRDFPNRDILFKNLYRYILGICSQTGCIPDYMIKYVQENNLPPREILLDTANGADVRIREIIREELLAMLKADVEGSPRSLRLNSYMERIDRAYEKSRERIIAKTILDIIVQLEIFNERPQNPEPSEINADTIFSHLRNHPKMRWPEIISLESKEEITPFLQFFVNEFYIEKSEPLEHQSRCDETYIFYNPLVRQWWQFRRNQGQPH